MTFANSNTLDSKFAHYDQDTIIRDLRSVGSLEPNGYGLYDMNGLGDVLGLEIGRTGTLRLVHPLPTLRVVLTCRIHLYSPRLIRTTGLFEQHKRRQWKYRQIKNAYLLPQGL